MSKILKRLRRLDQQKFRIIRKKIAEIRERPHAYKNLSAPLHRWKRVHIQGSFVLCYSVDDNTKTITLEDFDHHDRIYRRQD